MRFVAVKGMMDVVLSRSLKRDALIFDRVAIPNFHIFRGISPQDRDLRNELEYLFENGIVFEPSIKPSPIPENNAPDPGTMGEEYRKCLEYESYWFEEMMDSEGTRTKYSAYTKSEEEDEKVRTVQGLLALQYNTRRVGIYLREVEKLDAYPVFCEQLRHPYESGLPTNIVQITLSSLPVPKDITSWEQILEFRDDPDSRCKFLALRNWMSEVGKGQFTQIEILQKIEYLLSEYSRHMELHKIRTNPGILRTIVLRGAEAAENIAKLNFSKLANSIFFLHQKRIALMESEATAPGREIAYIYKASQEL
jgi:hypothetical protein